MKRYLVIAVLAALLLCSAGAFADAEGVIVQSSCNILQSGEYYLVYTFAQVHNNSDSIICLDQGTFELHNGEQMLASQNVTRMWPYFLNPGEDGYLFDIVSFEPDEDGTPVVPSVTAIDYNITYMPVAQAFGSMDLSAVSEIETGAADGSLRVVCEITNPSDEAAYEPNISFGLYTDAGQMIYADGMTLEGVGIPAGGTVLVRFDVEEAFVSQWTSYGVTPTQAHVNASFRTETD
ncbi:MAG: hypothetical protein IKU34_09865 [Clostridia bacterium]|nr:hypothetical protein [Clostridia bacterium]